MLTSGAGAAGPPEGGPHVRQGGPHMRRGGAHIGQGIDIGTRETFADLGQTLAANFGVGPLASGTSFLEDIVVHHP